MRILITGSSGFIGQNLLKYLDHFDLKLLRREQLRTVSAQLFEKDDVIIHLAGKAHDLKKSLSPQQYYEVNYELTKKLYQAFLSSNAKKFIFISSVKAVADSVEESLNEDYIPNPQTHYGKSKLMAEQYIQGQSLPAGKSYYILRPCMIHGPGNKGNLNLLYKFVKMGVPYPLAGFDNRRSLLSVENLCFVIKELIQRAEIPSGVYQIADDEPLSTNQVVKLLASATGVKPKLWKVSRKLVCFLARCGDILHLPLTTERLNKLTESYVVSNNKIRQVLKKEFPLTTVQGLIATAESFEKE
jgi:nucleoside-diphosphate-sugar epimerase